MDPLSRRQFVGSALGAGLAAGVAGASVDVREHGATGDGKHDDTDAFQNAVDATDGAVRLSAGNYRLVRPVVISLDRRGYTSIVGDGTARLTMDGPGPALHFVGTHEGTADPGTMSDRIWSHQRLPLVSGFEILGEHEQAVGARFEGTVQATITNLLVRQCRVGLQFVKRNRNAIVSQCHVYQNREIGIDFDHVNLHQAIISSCHVSYNPVAGIRLTGGDMRNFQIIGCDIEYNYDFERNDCADVLIDMREPGSSFREGTIVGNTIQAKPSPNGANVRFLGGDAFKTGGMMAITGNFISNQTTNIHLDRCRMVSVTGNAMCGATDRTLRLERSAALTVNGNAIDWNPHPRGKQHRDGITIRDCRGVIFSDMIVENCMHETQAAIDVRDSEDVAMDNCQVLDPESVGIALTDVVRCKVTGCTVIDRRVTRQMKTSIAVSGKSRHNLVANNMVTAKSLRVDSSTATVRDNEEILPS